MATKDRERSRDRSQDTVQFLPNLIDTDRKPWTIREVEIQDSSVDLTNHKANVPRPFTESQKLARRHELGHVKYTPKDWHVEIPLVMRHGPRLGVELDPTICLWFSKMVEENRIDWLLWSRKRIDLRPCREALAWDGMPLPTEYPIAVGNVLQLVWTVWASRGLKKLPDAPPEREPDEETAEYFDKCWAIVGQHPRGNEIAVAIVRGCLAIYKQPTDIVRRRVAAELASFFPIQELPTPDEKEEEKEEQREAKQKQAQVEQTRDDDSNVEVTGGHLITRGILQIHDHTIGRRRPKKAIPGIHVPKAFGTKLRYPQRYMLDKNVFGKKQRSQASIMVDVSGSMRWSHDDLMQLMDRMPAAWVGIHGGFEDMNNPSGVFGRICVLAKDGRFANFNGLDTGFNNSNAVDIESLEVLGQWPGPRFWLSDGFVWGGPHVMKRWPGDSEDTPQYDTPYLQVAGYIVYHVNRLMKRHGILRVNDMATLLQLLERKPVTLYRSCINYKDASDVSSTKGHGRTPAATFGGLEGMYPPHLREEPVRFSL